MRPTPCESLSRCVINSNRLNPPSGLERHIHLCFNLAGKEVLGVTAELRHLDVVILKSLLNEENESKF